MVGGKRQRNNKKHTIFLIMSFSKSSTSQPVNMSHGEAGEIVVGTVPSLKRKIPPHSPRGPPTKKVVKAGGPRVTPIPRTPATVTQGVAAMSKGATPAMKKSVIDRQIAFSQDTLYTSLEDLGKEMLLEDPTFIYFFYHSYLKPHLLMEIDSVKIIKTGGAAAPHLTQFTPLNRHLQINPDIVELCTDVKSLKQVKFYKMLIFRVMERVNTSLVAAGFKGKIYLKKNFYSAFQDYWEGEVAPAVEAMKKKQKEAAAMKELLGDEEETSLAQSMGPSLCTEDEEEADDETEEPEEEPEEEEQDE